MKRAVRAFQFSIALFLTVALVSGCRNRKPDPAQALAEKVAAIRCFSSDIEKELADMGERLDGLRTDESANADKALVMLMGYYLGEHNDEELYGEIVRRGKRMRPLLEQAQEHPTTLSTCARKNELVDVRGRAKSLITAIDHGTYKE